jgi:polyhydroxyalkanoate synthase
MLAALTAIEKAREELRRGLLPGRHPARRHARLHGGDEDRRIASATFMTSLVDFSRSGELEGFIDEEQVASLERR